MKVQFKHTAVLPYVDRVLQAISGVDPEIGRCFPRPIDEIITLCYPLAIVEVPGLDTRRAHLEIAKLSPATAVDAGTNQKLAGCLFVKDNDGVILVESASIAERKRFTKAHELEHFLLQGTTAAGRKRTNR